MAIMMLCCQLKKEEFGITDISSYKKSSLKTFPADGTTA
jgi:hypothetical protein